MTRHYNGEIWFLRQPDSFNKEQFKLREHLERLYKGIKILEIPMKIGIDELEEICHETVKINEPFSMKMMNID